MLLFAAERHTCGFSARCVNDVQDALLAADATLLFLHIAQISGRRGLSFIVAILWCLSLPAMGAALWQSTQFDKLVMIFSLIYLMVLFHYVKLDKISVYQKILCNNLLLVFLFLAFKSKESAFFLIPVTALVVLIDKFKLHKAGMVSSLKLIIAPILYGVYHIQYVMLHLPDNLRTHVSSGAIRTVTPKLIMMLFGYGEVLGTGNWGDEYEAAAGLASDVMITAVIFVFISFLVAVVVERQKYSSFSQLSLITFKNLLYLLGLILSNLVIVVKTAQPAAYYMMLIEGAFLAFIALAAVKPISGLPVFVDHARSSILLACLAAGVTLGQYSQYRSGAAAFRLRTESRMIEDSFAVIRASVQADQVKSARFYFAQPISGDWYFFHPVNAQPADPEILSAIYRKFVPTSVTYSSDLSALDPMAPRGVLQVVWNGDGSLQTIRLGDAPVLDAR
jgi:hypothetical protein